MNTKHTPGPWTHPPLTAGACFMEPEEGSLRVVVGTVYGALDDTGRPGLLVQEYVPQEDEDGFELVGCEWRDQCPLTDAHFVLPITAPVAWMAASRELRARIERGEPISLDMERAAIGKAGLAEDVDKAARRNAVNDRAARELQQQDLDAMRRAGVL